ncbi:hypothetical protein ACFE04_029755 [Oxalis oulophora]
MEKSAFSFRRLICLLLLFTILSGENLKPANAQENTWCVAKPSASDEELIKNIQYACDQVHDGCSVIAENGPCYYPNTLINHASVAMSLYYQFAGRHYWNCDFGTSGLITTTNPSYGDCKYTE